MTKSEKALLTQMIRAGRFNAELANLLRLKMEKDAKVMIKKMGTKYCCHPDNAPVKGVYGI